MNNKITPSPWSVNDKDYDRFGKTVWIEADNGHYVCELVRDGEHREFDNARLIAAAPDMLEVLENLVSIYEQNKDLPQVKEAYRFFEFKKIKSAVSKAKNGKA